MSEITQPEKVSVDKAQLTELIAQNRELKEMTARTIKVLFIILDIVGGKLPTNTLETTALVGTMIRKFTTGKIDTKELFAEITALMEVAPKYMNEEQKAKIADVLKSLHE